MKNINVETVLDVHHWNDKLFSFKTTRHQSLRFRNGEFVMIGLQQADKPLVRAYSIASPNYEEHLEFFSIKVPDGALTSQLQHLQKGSEIIVSKKPTGTLVIDDLKPGKRLFLFATGTGLAPFLSIIQDPETFDKFEQVILCHGVRHKSELAYKEFIEYELKEHPFIGEMIERQLRYFPTVTREPFHHQGRLTQHIEQGTLCELLGIPPLDPAMDRAMICGNPDMLRDIAILLEQNGFSISPKIGVQGDFVIERAFVE
ncbi:MAG: ferredoxin--NADP reductase [Gammaproteobacteria bacterium]|nr:ferredoxin--NADP reductase [Gammaproteobacteria bacterium]NVK89134.1 ferredoxin--NADP reductase [Gammaproteobacteria bacterium]